jgi:hypothetical protein
MKYLKKFGKFVEAVAAPDTKPAPSTNPATPTVEPGTKPERRDRPSPIRRDRPAVDPDPQAKLKKANAEDVVENFLTIASEEGFNFKKYFPKA